MGRDGARSGARPAGKSEHARAGNRRRGRLIRWVGAILLVLGIAGAVEARTSFFQSRFIAAWAQGLSFDVEPGPEPNPWTPPDGPYDQRLGYARLGEISAALEARGFVIDSQARISSRMRSSLERGLFPVYREKTRAGLRITDRRGAEMWSARYPSLAYAEFDSIPQLVVRSLLFVENRELLSSPSPFRNPAVEWDRLLGAVVRLAGRKLGAGEGNVAGGSTLATQIEKFRHSPGGRTSSPRQKVEQMATATVRAYKSGRETQGERERIVLDYVNSVPLSAIRGYGEVLGLKDGLERWFGIDAARADALLRSIERPRRTAASAAVDAVAGEQEIDPATGEPAIDPATGEQEIDPAAREPTIDPAGAGQAGDPGDSALSADDPEAMLTDSVAIVYRATLGLMLAQRRPSFYLADSVGRRELSRLTNVYLGIMRDEGEISARLDSVARAVQVEPSPSAPPPSDLPFVDLKAATSVRTQLLGLVGSESLYDLDRIDLSVRTTIDRAAQDTATRILARLADRAFVEESGLAAFRLLASGDPADVIYSFLLYELGEDANEIRVQTDNFDGPFDLNQASKLELGSTAKLRTLVTYLELAERLHGELAGLDAVERSAVVDSLRDPLTRWAADVIQRQPGLSVADMLEAAMQRRYSGNPAERFFTGGGTHVFQNFDNTYNGSILPVRQAFQQSVNLVFVRMMRDIERFYRARLPEATRALLDVNSPQRRVYLERFADREGQQFVNRFFTKYAAQDSAQILETLVSGRRMSPNRLAWTFRTIRPTADAEAFEAYLRAHSPEVQFTPQSISNLFERTNAESFSLADLGYLAQIHPLELWVARYRLRNPGAARAEAVQASQEARQEVYQWLFSPRRRQAQDRSVSVIVELESFLDIQRAWQRLGYPFDNLVASLGTSIGSSGDRPGALAELVGILLNDGIRLPTRQISTIELGVGTPYETHFSHAGREGVRVLSPEVARTAREALQAVVEGGTAQFLRGSVTDADGNPLPIGGKTGTGNNQYKVFGAGGRLVESRQVNRTATFAFFVGDRYFGVVTAHVDGQPAAAYQFTSALPLRVFRLVVPRIVPLLGGEAAPAGGQ